MEVWIWTHKYATIWSVLEAKWLAVPTSEHKILKQCDKKNV